MSQKNKKNNIETPMQEYEIFGEHKSREQIKAEEKARKEAQRKAVQEQLKAAKAAQAKSGKGKSLGAMLGGVAAGGMTSTVIMLAVFVALLVGALALAFSVTNNSERMHRDESNEAYYVNESAEPELSEEGITGAVREIYYTKGGHIAVRMMLGNGSDEHLRMTEIEVILEKEDGTRVAGGKAEVSSEFVILTNDSEEYTFYISPEHISEKVTEFTNLNCSILATGEPTV